MNTIRYGYKKELSIPFEEAVEKIKTSLKEKGFGILTEIDVKATLKEKLGIEFGKYVILGACNPPNAYKALKAEMDIGLMLPCNVVVYEKNGKTTVSVILPTVAMGMIDNMQLKDIANLVERKLKQAVLDIDY